MKEIIKKVFVYYVDKLAKIKGYNFPESFLWKWKLNQLVGLYEFETTLFFRRNIKKGMVIVDVGANIGYFTRLFSSLVGPSGKVYAFEPDQKNFELLKENTKKLKNVELFNSAVSDSVGNLDFFHIVGATGTHTLLPSPGAITKKVSSVTLDHFFCDKRPPDIIKVDVEGAEGKVFKGMLSLLKIKEICVVFEYQPTINKDLLDKLLKQYTLYSFTILGKLKSLERIRFRKGKVKYANVCLISRK